MFGGERGATGDHGQDGRQGPRGERGPAGPSEIEEDRDIREALALALDEKRRDRDKLVDRRLLIVYALVTVGLIGAFAYDERQDDRFREEIVSRCEDTNAGFARVNGVIDRLATNALSNRVRTVEEREQIAQQYVNLHLPIADCPPR